MATKRKPKTRPKAKAAQKQVQDRFRTFDGKRYSPKKKAKRP